MWWLLNRLGYLGPRYAYSNTLKRGTRKDDTFPRQQSGDKRDDGGIETGVRFDMAAKCASSLKGVCTKDQLRLYALYKQATMGDNTRDKPSCLDFSAAAKWEAWNELRGSRDEMVRSAYVELVNELALKMMNKLGNNDNRSKTPTSDEGSDEEYAGGSSNSMAPVVSVPVWNEAEKASPTLLDACKRGDIDLARRLLGTAKANISFRTKREVSIHDCTHTNTATSDTTEHNREEPRTPRQADEYEHAGVDRSLLADGGMGEMRQDDEQTSLNIDAQDENGMTCLHWACDRGHPDIVRALVEKCADVGVTDNDGQSALHYAAFCGHLDVVRVLLWAGADREIEDNHGQTALDCADDFPDIMELLGSSRHSSLLAEK